MLLEPGPRFNVLSGDNGQGKTNVLESIYAAGTLRSFRTQRLAELIAFDEEQAYIGARVSRQELVRKCEVTLLPGSKRVRLDGKPVRPLSKYFGEVNVVLFAPEDLQIPRTSPSERRRFLDRAVFHFRSDYLAVARSYEKALKNRNATLRSLGEKRTSANQARTLLEVYDEQLSSLGAQVVTYRQAFLAAIAPRFAKAFELISGSDRPVSATYELPPPEIGDTAEALTAALLSALRDHQARDLARGVTSVGPHRHDIVFAIDDRPASSFASQGQLRALVLAWKTAEMQLLTDVIGESPILLLDDVSSELDATRNEYLFEFLRNQPAQCFITTTHAKHVLLATDRVDYHVQNGSVRRQNK